MLQQQLPAKQPGLVRAQAMEILAKAMALTTMRWLHQSLHLVCKRVATAMLSQQLLAKQPDLVRGQAMEILAKAMAQAMALQHLYQLVLAPHRRQRLVGCQVPPLHPPVVDPV